jgi:hypothetical protein
MVPTVSSSSAPQWLQIFAVLDRMSDDAVVNRALFDRSEAGPLWDWAEGQVGAFAASAPPWICYSEGQLVACVREGFPLWVGILALHPTPAASVERLVRSSALAPFASHGVAEWREWVRLGRPAPQPTFLALVSRDNDWESFLRHATQTWLAPNDGVVYRPAVPPSSPRVGRPRLKQARWP